MEPYDRPSMVLAQNRSTSNWKLKSISPSCASTLVTWLITGCFPSSRDRGAGPGPVPGPRVRHHLLGARTVFLVDRSQPLDLGVLHDVGPHRCLAELTVRVP